MRLSFTKNTSAAGTLGLDIDGHMLAAVQVSKGRVERAVNMELPAGLVKEGEVADPQGLAAALKQFVSAHRLPRNVRLGVSNQQIVVRVIDLPPIEDPTQRDAAVRFQAAEAIAMPLDEAILDHQLAGFAESPDGSRRMQVVLVAARRSMIESLVQAAKGAGLKPQGVDLNAFALVRILADGLAGDEQARVYCHLGGITNLAIAVGSTCLFTRPLSASWQDPHAGAQLADEVRLSIDYYMAQPGARPVAGAVLSGAGSQDEHVFESLVSQLGMTASLASPLGPLDGSPAGLNGDAHLYTVAAGLALGEDS
jgi:type IV pilus assembly protein PilM